MPVWRKWLKPTFGDLPIGKIDPATVRVWHSKAVSEHPGSTQPAKAYRLLSTMLNIAVSDGKIIANPCRVEGAAREVSPERPVATEQQVEDLADAIGEDWRPMVLLGAYCSMRLGELAGLRRCDVDLLHGTITIVQQAIELKTGEVVLKAPKADSVGTVSIPPDIVPDLEDHLGRLVDPAPGALLFTSPTGMPIRRTKFRLRWLSACKGAGVEGLHFHDLRGTGATMAAQEGATTAELMHRLRHRTVTAAMRYQHATAERDRAIADRLGARRQAARKAMTERADVIEHEIVDHLVD
jgi:integrase